MIKVYDRKFELVMQFNKISAFEKWNKMKPRTAYYHAKKGEMIIWKNGIIKYQVRFV